MPLRLWYMELVYLHGKTSSFQYRNWFLPWVGIQRFSACTNESLVAMTILEMDPGIIVTIFNNQEGLAGPAGAELWPGCPVEYEPWVTLMLKAGPPCLEQWRTATPSGHHQENTKVFSVWRSVGEYFKKHQPAYFMQKIAPCEIL